MATMQELFDLAVKMGIEADPRGKKEVQTILKETAEKYKHASEHEKKYFDKDTLTNPYHDTRIYAGDPKAKIKRILVGIDCEIQELLLACELGRQGKKIDAVMTHHPEGRALLDLDKVMSLQIDTAYAAGVPEQLADSSMLTRMREVEQGVHANNAYRSVHAAQLLGMNYFNAHTPADNYAEKYMKDHLAKKEYRTLKDIANAILEIPEFHEGALRGDGPKLYHGSHSNRPGKLYISMTGGTSFAIDMIEKLRHAGVGTIIEMHFSQAAVKEAQKHGINVICAGHIPADSLGMNHLLDAYEALGVEIVPTSGLIRIKRKAKK